MTTFSFHKGDLLESEELVIAHGCNTYGVMGAGIAGQISKRYPSMFRAYKAACLGGEFVLGSAQFLEREPSRFHPEYIFNLGTQWSPGPNATLWGVFLSFANMVERSRGASVAINRVAIPRIGCGIGGLTWDEVEPTIERAIDATGFKGFHIAVYDL